MRTRNLDQTGGPATDNPAATQDRVLTLRDGRRLNYHEYGAPDGRPVVALHGTPGSRLKFAVAGEAAAQRGLRLISPDRWGYGGSDAPLRPSLAKYADDIADLADGLGVGRLALVGLSGGGPYAATTAALLRDRISDLALIAPVAPLARPGELKGVSLFHRLSFRALPLLPGGITLTFAVLRAALAISPDAAVRLISARAGRPDRQVLASPEVRRSLAATFMGGIGRSLAGTRIDMTLFSRDWGCDPGRISARSCLWIGTHDRNVPQAAAIRLAGQIPGCRLERPAQAGHFWVISAFDQVLDWLAEVH